VPACSGGGNVAYAVYWRGVLILLIDHIRRNHEYLYASSAFLVAALVLAVLLGMLSEGHALNRQLIDLPVDLEADYAYLKSAAAVSTETIEMQPFTPAPWNGIPLEFGDQVYWLRLRLSNRLDTSRALFLLMDNPMMNRLEVFRPDQTGAMERLMLGGDHTSGRPFELALPHLGFELGPMASQTLFVRAQTDGAPILPLSIMEAEGFAHYQRSLHLVWGAFIGTVLLMAIYNLLLYQGLKDRTYLYYVGYVLSLMVMLGVVHGYGNYLFPRSLQQWLSQQVISLNTVATLLTFLFGVHFLKYSTKAGPLARPIRLFNLALILFLVVTFFFPEYLTAQWYAPFQALMYLMAFWLIIRRIPDKLVWTRYYIVSWIPLCVGGAVAYLLFSGYLEYSFYTRHAFPVAIILEMALISMALADRFAVMERARLHQATHDGTLGLANEALLAEAIRSERRHGKGSDLALIAVEISDLDALRPYITEDTLRDLLHGLSRLFSAALTGPYRPSVVDAHARVHKHTAVMRGDILCFLLHTPGEEALVELLERISNRDNFNPIEGRLPYRVQCHLAAVLIGAAETPTELLAQTRRALAAARNRQQRWHLRSAVREVDHSQKIRLAQDLVNAIESGGLSLFHQPQLSLSDTDQVASELLIRWNHPEQGWIPAVQIITIAEETGLIRSLTRWVIHEALRHARLLHEATAGHAVLSINVSASDLSRPEFATELIEAREQTALSADCLILEVTESAHFSERAAFERNFRYLTEAGFRLAIDDFGTGYSSLSYAHQHPFSELKIDRSFVSALLSDARTQTIVAATVSMARQLRLAITAEGVEDEPTAIYLKALGCDRLQGFWIAKPIPLEEYLKWLQDEHSHWVACVRRL